MKRQPLTGLLWIWGSVIVHLFCPEVRDFYSIRENVATRSPKPPAHDQITLNPFIDLKIIIQRPSFRGARDRIWTLDMFKDCDLIVVGKVKKGLGMILSRLLQADEIAYSIIEVSKYSDPKTIKSMNNAWFYPNWMKEFDLWLFWTWTMIACSQFLDSRQNPQVQALIKSRSWLGAEGLPMKSETRQTYCC